MRRCVVTLLVLSIVATGLASGCSTSDGDGPATPSGVAASPSPSPTTSPTPTVTPPGRPAALLPARWSVISEVRPKFEWKAAKRADTYEVRVYRNGKVILTKAGIGKRSWKSPRALPKLVTLTWRVRAANAGGEGRWSGRNSFTIDPSACFT